MTSTAGADRLSSGAGSPWTEITIEAPAGAEDDLAAVLCDAGATGVRAEAAGANVVLRAAFTDPAACPSEEEIRERIRRAPGSASEASLISVATMTDDRWVERWIAALAPFPVGERILVVPVPDLDAAEFPDAPAFDAAGASRDREPASTREAARIPIWICPSRAFGTGEHATTRMCLEALESLRLGGRSLLDVGTGSGILAVAGARLGCDRIVAIDNDPEAIGVARANLRLNGLAARIDLLCGALPALAPSSFDVVVANLNGFILSSIFPDLAGRVAPGGTLILSGLLDSEASAIAERMTRPDIHRGRVIRREGWACVVRESAGG